jgi:hypothetical protein
VWLPLSSANMDEKGNVYFFVGLGGNTSFWSFGVMLDQLAFQVQSFV